MLEIASFHPNIEFQEILEGDFPVSGKITSRVLDKWKRIVSNRRYLVQKNGFDMVSESGRINLEICQAIFLEKTHFV